MRNFQLITLAIILAAVFACSKTNPPISVRTPQSPQSPQSPQNPQSPQGSHTIIFDGWILSSTQNVYAAGWEDSSATYNLKYWKNGVGIYLPNHYGEAPNQQGIEKPSTTGITVSGGDVYVCGRDYDPVTNTFLAAYWKNGIETMLYSNKNNSWSHSIAVSGNDVYVSGGEEIGNHFIATWWKNGIPFIEIDTVIIFTNSVNGTPVTVVDTLASFAGSVAVLGNDVYVPGFVYNGTHNIALYWKNGNPIYLGDSSVDASANFIAISGSDVYISGFMQDFAHGKAETAVYWKNGNPVTLTMGYPNGITVSGNDIYIAGTQPMGPAMYWKNNTLNFLPFTNAICISVSASDIYIGGTNNNGEPTIWKNGVPSSSPAQGEILSIFLDN